MTWCMRCWVYLYFLQHVVMGGYVDKENCLCKNELGSFIVSFKYFQLSLRDNPLVVRFVRDMTLQPPSLLELAGRTIKLHEIPIREGEVPYTLMKYLCAAQCCVNPKCKGWFVFFRSCRQGTLRRSSSLFVQCWTI